jgi:hypothetical protein
MPTTKPAGVVVAPPHAAATHQVIPVPNVSSSSPLNDVKDEETKKAQWAQVFATLQSCGLSDRAMEYAQLMGKLGERTKELTRLYKEAVSSEEALLGGAYQEALAAHQEKEQRESGDQAMASAFHDAIQMQVNAQRELEEQGAKLHSEVQQAHVIAARKMSEHGVGAKLPSRPGAAACQFFVRTGDCAYGLTCKWDHPDRAGPRLNSKGFPMRDNMGDCPFFMKTGDCKFSGSCKWNHPQAIIDTIWPQAAQERKQQEAALQAMAPGAGTSV